MHMKCIASVLGVVLGVIAQGVSLPVAIVSESQDARLFRLGSALPIIARQGDLLYAGDRLEGDAEIAVCGSAEGLNFSHTVRVTRPQPCALPPVARERVTAGHGAALTRSIHNLEDSEEPATSSPATQAVGSLVDRVTRAELMARDGRPAAAGAEYRGMLKDFPDAKALAVERLFVLEEEVARKQAPKTDPTIGGKTYALLIGISKFENIRIRPLRYAHEDAIVFEQFLRSPRGGGLAAEDIQLLANEQATNAAIRTAFETLIKKATPKDTVIVLMATHGTVIESPRSRTRGAYIVAYDSDPENLSDTGIPMSLVQRHIREDLAKAARVMAFVDACRSGTIGTIPEKNRNQFTAALESLAQTETQLFLFTASRPGEVSYEGRQYGGGHGAFSFFLLEAMNGSADFDADGKVSVNEMVTYVQQKVAEATVDKQHPREAGTLDMNVRVADATKSGISLGTFQPGLKEPGAERGFATTESRNQAVRIINIRPAADFDEALAEGRLLPDQPRNAFTAFRQLKLARRLSRDQILDQENRLRTALENRNQRVILQYLRGEEAPMTKAQFTEAARTINAAIQMNGETPDLVGRLLFCEGRIAMFEKNYTQARKLFENALRNTANSAYIYNALGTAYLEQAEYDLAEKAFTEASKLAPLWAYPRHNLALTMAQRGDYERALSAYDEAIRVAPQWTYLIYNQGLIYQELNRLREAEACFRKAADRWPERPEPMNALGALRLSQGKAGDAEKLFRLALVKNDSYLAARQNLADVIASRSGRDDEALTLWRRNLELDPGFVPSRLAAAKMMEKKGRRDEAVAEYRTLIETKPEFVGARLALAELLMQLGDHQGALDQFSRCKQIQPNNPLITIRMADLAALSGERREAAELYQRALNETADPSLQRQIRSKLQAAVR